MKKLSKKAENQAVIIHNDIENLRLYGLDIIGEKQDKAFSYYIGSRQFELAELKLLVDSIQSAKFITAKILTKVPIQTKHI